MATRPLTPPSVGVVPGLTVVSGLIGARGSSDLKGPDQRSGADRAAPPAHSGDLEDRPGFFGALGGAVNGGASTAGVVTMTVTERDDGHRTIGYRGRLVTR